MFGNHITGQLTAYHHSELSLGEKFRVEGHLNVCAKCRAALDEIRFGARLASALSVSAAPDWAWSDVHASPPASTRPVWRRRIPQAVIASALAAAAVLLVVIMQNPIPVGPAWRVTGLPGTSFLKAGEVLQTDSATAAQLKIADVGEITIAPDTRIRLLVTQADEHRLALDHGRLEAFTWSPPRLFIVETPLAAAVDLGCKYTLEVEEDGGSMLHVTLGLVALERDGRETIVPAGAFCRTRRATGPGTPYFEDSTTRFQTALDTLDASTEGPERTRQLQIVLSEAGVRDALSLWHLLFRLDSESRGLIHDRLAQSLPPPPEVTREGIITLDPKMIEAWEKIVSQLWQ